MINSLKDFMEQEYPPARAQVSEIVHAPNLKNKIGAGFALILSLRNSGENPSLLRRSGYEGRKYEAIQHEKSEGKH